MTISTHHLQDENLSLRAKGLLSVMLTLPDDWRFTLSGLAAMCNIKGESYRLKERKEYMKQKQHIVNTLFEQNI